MRSALTSPLTETRQSLTDCQISISQLHTIIHELIENIRPSDAPIIFGLAAPLPISNREDFHMTMDSLLHQYCLPNLAVLESFLSKIANSDPTVITPDDTQSLIDIIASSLTTLLTITKLCQQDEEFSSRISNARGYGDSTAPAADSLEETYRSFMLAVWERENAIFYSAIEAHQAAQGGASSSTPTTCARSPQAIRLRLEPADLNNYLAATIVYTQALCSALSIQRQIPNAEQVEQKQFSIMQFYNRLYQAIYPHQIYLPTLTKPMLHISARKRLGSGGFATVYAALITVDAASSSSPAPQLIEKAECCSVVNRAVGIYDREASSESASPPQRMIGGVAVKVIPTQKNGRALMHDTIIRSCGDALQEARCLSQLSHPHVVEFFGIFHAKGHYNLSLPFVVIEQLGYTLEAYVSAYRATQAEALKAMQNKVPFHTLALAWLKGMLEALRYFSSMELLHLDIKPSNILLVPGRPWHIKLIDFGQAKERTEGCAYTGDTFGTKRYMPPKTVLSAQKRALHFPRDLYSVGTTMVYLFSSGSWWHIKKRSPPPKVLQKQWENKFRRTPNPQLTVEQLRLIFPSASEVTVDFCAELCNIINDCVTDRSPSESATSQLNGLLGRVDELITQLNSRSLLPLPSYAGPSSQTHIAVAQNPFSCNETVQIDTLGDKLPVFLKQTGGRVEPLSTSCIKETDMRHSANFFMMLYSCWFPTDVKEQFSTHPHQFPTHLTMNTIAAMLSAANALLQSIAVARSSHLGASAHDTQKNKSDLLSPLPKGTVAKMTLLNSINSRREVHCTPKPLGNSDDIFTPENLIPTFLLQLYVTSECFLLLAQPLTASTESAIAPPKPVAKEVAAVAGLQA